MEFKKMLKKKIGTVETVKVYDRVLSENERTELFEEKAV